MFPNDSQHMQPLLAFDETTTAHHNNMKATLIEVSASRALKASCWGFRRQVVVRSRFVCSPHNRPCSLVMAARSQLIEEDCQWC